MFADFSSRTRALNTIPYKSGPIIYWMNRDQRVEDNWALLAAQAWAKELGVAFAVAHNLVPAFLGGGARQWQFKVRGLKEVQASLEKKGIPFYLFTGPKSHLALLKWATSLGVGGMVTDFFPLRISTQWLNEVVAKAAIPIYQVDAHNIVPCWIVSPKQEFAARTIRPKLQKQLTEYLTDFPAVKKQSSFKPFAVQSYEWDKIEALCSMDIPPLPVDWIAPGERAAKKALKTFIEERLSEYAEKGMIQQSMHYQISLHIFTMVIFLRSELLSL